MEKELKNNNMSTPLKQIWNIRQDKEKWPKITFAGSGVNVDFLGKGTQHASNWGPHDNWFEGHFLGEKHPSFGSSVHSPKWSDVRDQVKTKTTKTYRANLDWGNFSLFGERSKSHQSFLNKPFTGFEEDAAYSGTTQTTNFGGLGPYVTFSDERDIAGSSHTAYGQIHKTRTGGGANIYLSGDKKTGFMATLEASGGRQKTSQDYYTISASGRPLRPGINLTTGNISYSGGRGEVGKTQVGNTTTVKPYGSTKLSLLYGDKSRNRSVFGEYDTDTGPALGATARFGWLSGGIKKTISEGISGNLSLNIPINRNK